MKILSIDWDYFIDCTSRERAILFPDGGNEYISPALQMFIWESHYSTPDFQRSYVGKSLEEIKVREKDFNAVLKIIKGFKGTVPPAVAISHRFIYPLIMENSSPETSIELYNVDFHHDRYFYRDPDKGEVNCGNWVNYVLENRPNTKYYWIKREDSEEESLGGKVDYIPATVEDLKEIDFDAIFLCRSDCWSPPHLDTYFNVLARAMKKGRSTSTVLSDVKNTGLIRKRVETKIPKGYEIMQELRKPKCD